MTLSSVSLHGVELHTVLVYAEFDSVQCELLWDFCKFNFLTPVLVLYPPTKGVKRGVSKVYLALKYLEDNIYNVHLQSLH